MLDFFLCKIWFYYIKKYKESGKEKRWQFHRYYGLHRFYGLSQKMNQTALVEFASFSMNRYFLKCPYFFFCSGGPHSWADFFHPVSMSNIASRETHRAGSHFVDLMICTVCCVWVFRIISKASTYQELTVCRHGTNCIIKRSLNYFGRELAQCADFESKA